MLYRQASVALRAEVTSSTDFDLKIEGNCTPDSREAIICDIEAALGEHDTFSVRQTLSSSDKCNLDACWYLRTHETLTARRRGSPGAPFCWLPLPDWVVEGLSAFSRRDESCRVPDHVWMPRGLMPYQQTAVRRALAQEGCALLADEMGLGKTVQALAIIAQYLDQEGPALVVTPSSLGAVWRQQALQWLKALKPSEIQLVRSAREHPRSHAKLVIVPYALFIRAKALSSTPSGQPWQIVACDEAHCLRNPDSQRGKVLLPVLHRARRRLLITGTPTPKQASEAYTLLHGLKQLSCDFNEWCSRYGGKFTEQREAEIAALLYEVMVRRTKASVLDQLPPKHRRRIELQLPAKALRQLKSEKADDLGMAGDDHFRLLSKLKEAATQEYVDYLLEASEEKFLLFAHHISMLDALSAVLDRHGTSHIRIEGATKVEERVKLIQKFQEDPRCRVAVLSVTAAGEGITLTAAARVVFCELCPAVPGVIEQAEARVHRLGQRAGSVDVHFLVVEGTGDDRVFQRLEARGSAVEKVLVDNFTQPAASVGVAEEAVRAVAVRTSSTAAAATSSAPPRKRLRRASLDSVLDEQIGKAQAELDSRIGRCAEPQVLSLESLPLKRAASTVGRGRASRAVLAKLPAADPEEVTKEVEMPAEIVAEIRNEDEALPEASAVDAPLQAEESEEIKSKAEPEDPLSSLLDELLDAAQKKIK
eukprot:TRINITY_DN7758_c0_g1_i1.p1 TRINITY_DN7758_c0_g1~~TRINITY_DN7758_c0_g1_i1.p1  ORF type:complete len:727 (-),score=171.73 TRINITY_DN7758_c0_g1_i1:97-2211(-)